jgi:hypothetical protein
MTENFLLTQRRIMSDINRKPIATQVEEKLTPDHQKTAGEQVKETVTGVVDRAAALVTPDSKKSLPQQAADKTRGATDDK